MQCPFCHHSESKVINKRSNEAEDTVRRRRECLSCQKRFTTYERVERDLVVVKKDGRREPFQREKLAAGIHRACEKRPVPTETIQQTIGRIEAILREKSRAEVTSQQIGELVMRELKKLDKVAYIRFASVYRDFEDVEDFEKELMIIKRHA